MFYVFGPAVSDEVKAAFNTRAAKDGLVNLSASIATFPGTEPFSELMFGESAEATTTMEAAIKGQPVAFIQSTSAPVSDHAMQTLLALRTLKRYGAGPVALIAPFQAFARQDKRNHGRMESIGGDDYAFLLKAAGANSIVTAEVHSRASESFLSNHLGAENVTLLSMDTLFADYAKSRFDLANVMVGAPDGADKPDDAGQRRARLVRENLFGGDEAKRLIKIWKEHTGIHQTKILKFEGDVKGKDCLIVDDMADGGSTLINASNAVKDKGARSSHCMITHAILSGNALEKILTHKRLDGSFTIDALVITDTNPDVSAKIARLSAQYPNFGQRVKLLSTADMIYAATRKELQRLAPK